MISGVVSASIIDIPKYSASASCMFSGSAGSVVLSWHAPRVTASRRAYRESELGFGMVAILSVGRVLFPKCAGLSSIYPARGEWFTGEG